MHGLKKITFPLVYALKRKNAPRTPLDIPAVVRKAVGDSSILKRLRPGAEVAITAGSRGIANIAEILREIGAVVREAGGIPFALAAMGSHGGATGDGQLKMLAGLGITPESVGMDVRAPLDAVEIARSNRGVGVWINSAALKAGGVIVVNRVKPHSSVTGRHQSGIVKMLAVGLGAREGADEFHRHGPLDMSPLMVELAEEILPRAPIMGGIGVVEDESDRTAIIRAAGPENFIELDAELLAEAERMSPRLPFDRLDALIVDEMGKDKSGVGMDANIIGRRGIRFVPDPERPVITRIVALALSEKTFGNAHGVGLADFVTRKLASAIDWKATMTNAMTSRFPEKAALPPVFETERDAVAAALMTCRVADTAQARLVRIKSTGRIDTILASESLMDEIRNDKDWEISGGPFDLKFD